MDSNRINNDTFESISTFKSSPLLTPSGDSFPLLEHRASELAAYVLNMGRFIISLKDGRLVYFSPADINAFKDWLYCHGVVDLHEECCGIIF